MCHKEIMIKLAIGTRNVKQRHYLCVIDIIIVQCYFLVKY